MVVPDVTGLFYGACLEVAGRLGLHVAPVRLTPHPMPVDGLVVGQTPAPGERAHRDEHADRPGLAPVRAGPAASLTGGACRRLARAPTLGPLVDIAPARQYGHQAAELARQLGDDRLLADALAMLSAAHFFAGEPDRGLRLGREAVDRARQLGDDDLLGRSLMICLLSGDLVEPAQSARLLAEAIACTERSGDQLLRSFLHNNAAVQALRTGDVPAARAHLDQAAQAAQAIGQENPAVAANLGWVQREEGNPDAARSSFEASLRIGRRSGEQPVIAYAILGLGCLAADLGDWDRSAVLHGVAQAFLDRSGEPWQDARGAVPAAQPRPGARAPGRRPVRPRLRPGPGAQPRRGAPDGPRERPCTPGQLTLLPRPAQGVDQGHLVRGPAGHPDEVGAGHDDGQRPGP